MEEKKCDITTYMSSKVKWTEIPLPDSRKKIVVDLDAIAIQSCIMYVQKEKFAMDFVYEFFTGQYLDEISSIYKSTIEEIKSIFDDITYVSSSTRDAYDIPKLSSLNYESLIRLKKNVHSYIIKRSDINHYLLRTVNENIIFPTEEHLYDKALLMKSINCDVIITYDPHVLAFGKDEVYKFYCGKWFIKTKNNFNDAMNLGDIEDFTYSCLLLGTRFGKAKKETTLKKIRSCKSKKQMVIEELSGSLLLDYLKIF